MPKLPLFPLNTVLFPGNSLSLHVFEDRYKLMIGRCIEANQPFGVVLIKRGAEVMTVGSTVEPYFVGCTAQITQAQALGGGRMNITTVGLERFQIVALQRDQPYLTGEFELFPLKIDQPEAIRRSARLLRPWVKRYLNLLEQTEKIPFETKRLPQDSLALAYNAAALLKTSPMQQQELLAAPDALHLVESVYALYRKEVTLLKAILLHPRSEHESRFSLN